jgi:hypothetical protein
VSGSQSKTLSGQAMAVMVSERNPSGTRDELILALDLYHRHKGSILPSTLLPNITTAHCKLL